MVTATPRKKTQAEHLALQFVRQAKETLGNGWNHVSRDVQWGLVAASILAAYLDHEENPLCKTRRFIQEITTEAHELVYFQEQQEVVT